MKHKYKLLTKYVTKVKDHSVVCSKYYYGIAHRPTRYDIKFQNRYVDSSPGSRRNAVHTCSVSSFSIEAGLSEYHVERLAGEIADRSRWWRMDWSQWRGGRMMN